MKVASSISNDNRNLFDQIKLFNEKSLRPNKILA